MNTQMLVQVHELTYIPFALFIFATVFFLIVYRVYRKSQKKHYEQMANSVINGDT